MFPFSNLPGYPGPAMVGHRVAIAPVVPPVIGGPPRGPAPAGLPNSGGPNHTSGLPAHLLRLMESARAGRLVPPAMDGGGFRPPDIAGMPKMPPPPPGFMAPAPASGLLQPLQPVQPFDHANQFSSQGQLTGHYSGQYPGHQV